MRLGRGAKSEEERMQGEEERKGIYIRRGEASNKEGRIIANRQNKEVY